MEVVGKIIEVLPIQEGVARSTGKPWKKGTYVLETQESFPRKIAFTAFGEDRVNLFNTVARPGAMVRLSFDIDSREYQGRWYTDIAGWKIEPADGAAPAAAAPAAAAPAPDAAGIPAPPPIVAPEKTDDLPF